MLRNNKNITIEKFIWSYVNTTGRCSFLAVFTNDSKVETTRVYCTPDHLKQLEILAGRHYATFRLFKRDSTLHLEKYHGVLFVNNAIMYLRKTKVPRKERSYLNAAYVLDFIIDASNSENDRKWLEFERPLIKEGLIDKYKEYLRFQKLTKDKTIARHCAGLEDFHLYHCAYVQYMSQNEEDTELVEVEADE